MSKIILITGSTDGIGFATAKSLLELGHSVLLHGRSTDKLTTVKKQLSQVASNERIFTYKADLSVMQEVKDLAQAIENEHQKLDVLINNAGVFVVPNKVASNGLDVRFMVNTIAPYLLTKLLLPLLSNTSRVINLSSAAQAPVTGDELIQPGALSDNAAYAKSKLALTMWSRQLALSLSDKGPVIVAVNPKSFLASKMVEQAYGVKGNNLQDGADILVRAALSDEFANASGLYFDNDTGQFAAPHPDALNPEKIAEITQSLEQLLSVN